MFLNVIVPFVTGKAYAHRGSPHVFLQMFERFRKVIGRDLSIVSSVSESLRLIFFVKI